MEFDKFSLFLKDTKSARFADDLANGKITATRCKKCATLYYPPRADCPKCMTGEIEWTELQPYGKLVTYTEIHIPPEHFASSTPFSREKFEPYMIGLIELENGLRIMGWMLSIKEPKTGMRMKAAPKAVDDRITIVLEQG